MRKDSLAKKQQQKKTKKREYVYFFGLGERVRRDGPIRHMAYWQLI